MIDNVPWSFVGCINVARMHTLVSHLWGWWEAWEEYINVREKAGWYADQRALWSAYSSVNPDNYQLPGSYISSHFTDWANIWHLKQKKKSDKLWKQATREVLQAQLT